MMSYVENDIGVFTVNIFHHFKEYYSNSRFVSRELEWILDILLCVVMKYIIERIVISLA